MTTVFVLILYLITGAQIVSTSTPAECTAVLWAVQTPGTDPVYALDGKETLIVGAECYMVEMAEAVGS